jgi:ParB-like chromosome segregation protein Spo0J
MQTVTLPLSELVLDPENARLHPEENLKAIEESLARFGQVLPLVVHAETKRVVGGNGTLQAMQRLGWSEADVFLFEGDLDQARALGIALNRTSELAEWDVSQLGATLAELEEMGLPPQRLGFSTEALDVMFPAVQEPFRADDADFKEDPKPAPPERPDIRYDLIFDTAEQQKRFFAFLKWLKAEQEGETTAERLDAYLQVVLG